MSQESAAKLAAAEQKSDELQAALNENAAVLNHAQKRVIILESTLEKEEKAREAAEEKCRVMKFEITDLCEKLADLNAQGIDVGDLERPLSRGLDDDGSLLTTSIASYVQPKFKAESEYPEEERGERHAAVTKLQLMYRKKQSYNKWFQMKVREATPEVTPGSERRVLVRGAKAQQRSNVT